MNWKIIIPFLIVGLVFVSGCTDTLKEVVGDLVSDAVNEASDKFEISCPDEILQYFVEEKTVYSDISPFNTSSDWYSEIEVPLLAAPVYNEIPCQMQSDDNLHCEYISPCVEQSGKYGKGRIKLTYSVSVEEREINEYLLAAVVGTLNKGKYEITLEMIDCKAKTVLRDTLEDCEAAEFSE